MQSRLFVRSLLLSTDKAVRTGCLWAKFKAMKPKLNNLEIPNVLKILFQFLFYFPNL